MKQIIAAMFLTLAAGLWAQSPQALAANQPDANNLSLEEMSSIVATKKAIIIDANSAKTYDEGHIPGAISFAKGKDKLASMLPPNKDALIVAYCGGPRCTAWEDAAASAKSLGYTNIKHFSGGIKVWKDQGKTVEK
jgi:rhodanese-related sulfurtransferase